MKSISFIASVTILLLPVLAQQEDERTGAYRASVSQTTLQTNTARMKEDLAAIIHDYERYGIAAVEVAKLKESVASLDGISGHDMPELVQLLLDASRSSEGTGFRDNLEKADGGQKQIQTRLRALADQLSLYSDQAAMQKRVEDLAVRQAAALRVNRGIAKELAGLGLTAEQLKKEVAALPADLPGPQRGDEEGKRVFELNRKKQRLTTEMARVAAEQAALEKETGLVTTALAKVAEDPMAPAATHFKQAFETARSNKLEEQARSAVQAGDSISAIPAQEGVSGTLRSIIAALDGARSNEERLRDLASQLSDLSVKEDGLANRTPKVWGEQKNRSMRDQFAIGDRLEVLQDRIKSLDSGNGAKTAEASTRAGELGEALKHEDFHDNVPLVSSTADGQKQLAKDMSAMSEALEAQANQLAANANGSAQPAQEPQLSPEAAAIQAAMKQLVDARINVELARRQNAEKLDSKSRVEQSRQNLASGTEEAKKAGAAVGQEVHQALADADQFSKLAATGDKVEHNLYHTNEKINEALAGLQEAAIKLAAQQQQQQGQGGESPFAAAIQAGGPVFSNLTEASDAQRDALSLLKQEKTAPEYETMVNQYIKNLAEETQDAASP
ncbi:hypothetical protein [Luteolibacter soli]|uniref:Uncharacterized protein n=1 Tax=Luteolibacter soli TaxID=3135280 RepID=A0ABU9B0M3_9BACT